MRTLTRRSLRVAALAVVLVPSPAGAAGGGNTTTTCSALTTICVAATATDASVCAKVTSLEAWQCTGVLVSSGTPAHGFRPPNTGGRVTWSGTATCEVRRRADGFNDHWTGWSACPGGSAKAAYDSRSWPGDASPTGGNLVFQWDPVVNYETAFATDCVEVRVSVETFAIASSNTLGVMLETAAASARQPASGVSVSGICEGGSPY